MSQNIIDTVFTIIQGSSSVARPIHPSLPPGTNEVFPVGVEGETLAPGIGVATEVRASNIVLRP